jgi:hypothetical protein
MNQLRHSQVGYVQTKPESCRRVNNPRFKTMTALANNTYEVQMAKERIELTLPTYLGLFVLQYSKLRMLSFYYDFLDVYIDRKHFQLTEMDTDSNYFAISEKSLQAIIKPEKLGEFQESIENQCDVDEISAETNWFPRSCCKKHIQLDKRTPGLFKEEFSGEGMISLCSKTYVVHGENGVKMSSKGVNKNGVKDPLSIFKRVLTTKTAQGGQNRGFRPKDGKVFSYTQRRNAFSYFYCKRRVHADGVTTSPLDLVLKPLPSPYLDQQNY